MLDLCLVGADQANPKNASDSPSVRPTKRKEPIKVDISVKVVPKPRKVSWTVENIFLCSGFNAHVSIFKIIFCEIRAVVTLASGPVQPCSSIILETIVATNK